jgi:DNA-binding CsgD family transcriptional regulator
MLLTPKDIRYIEICRLRAEGKTYAEISEAVDIGEPTIARAIKWGTRYGLFNQVAARKLGETIARLRKHQAWLERKLREHEKIISERKAAVRRGEKVRGQPALPTSVVNTFSSRLVDVEMQIAKLEGLYEETVNMHHSGSIDAAVTVYMPDNERGDRGD